MATHLKAPDADIQSQQTPSSILQLLKDGNERFLSEENKSRAASEDIQRTSNSQHPYAIVLSCIDSRVPTEIIFDLGIGDLFNACVAGNFANTDILGSMEYACKVAGSKLVVVLGHTACGGVKGACDRIQLGNITSMCANIYPAVDATTSAPGEDRSSKNIDFVNRVAAKNVALTVEKIKSDSPILKEMDDEGSIDIVGAMYDVQSGKVTWL